MPVIVTCTATSCWYVSLAAPTFGQTEAWTRSATTDVHMTAIWAASLQPRRTYRDTLRQAYALMHARRICVSQVPQEWYGYTRTGSRSSAVLRSRDQRMLTVPHVPRIYQHPPRDERRVRKRLSAEASRVCRSVLTIAHVRQHEAVLHQHPPRTMVRSQYSEQGSGHSEHANQIILRLMPPLWIGPLILYNGVCRCMPCMHTPCNALRLTRLMPCMHTPCNALRLIRLIAGW